MMGVAMSANPYRLSDADLELLSALDPIAEGVIAEQAPDVDAEGRFPQASMTALAQAGFYGLTIPAEMGGKGASLRTAAAAVDRIAQKCPSTAMVYLMHLCGVQAYLADSAKRAGELKAAAAGSHLTTLAWSEKGSRSHFWAPVSKADESNGGIKLNAEKSWVTSAGIADGYVVTTGVEPEGIDLFYVAKDDAGVEVAGPWNSMGMRGNASAPMTLTAAPMSDDRRMNERGQAFGVMMGNVLPQFATGNAAVSIGASEAVTQATASHLTASKLQHLGQSLADLPNLRARLAQMRIETDKARAHLASVFDAMESGDPAAMLWVLQAKAAAGDSAILVTDLAMKTCGGAAFSRHLGVERFFRDARAMSVMAPTSDVLHDFVGKAMLGMELFG